MKTMIENRVNKKYFFFLFKQVLPFKMKYISNKNKYLYNTEKLFFT